MVLDPAKMKPDIAPRSAEAYAQEAPGPPYPLLRPSGPGKLRGQDDARWWGVGWGEADFEHTAGRRACVLCW
jgi:hypothetical protein